jgi:hypothetical protein
LYNIYTVRKTPIQIQQVPWSLITALNNQRTNNTIRISDLSAWISASDYSSNQTIPAHSGTSISGVMGNSTEDINYDPAYTSGSPSYFTFDPSNSGDMITLDGSNPALNFGEFTGTGSFAIDLWVNFDDLTSGRTLIDTRNSQGTGIVICIDANNRLQACIQDSNGNYDYIYTSENALTTGLWTHISLIADGSSDIGYFVINGRMDGYNQCNAEGDSTGYCYNTFKELNQSIGNINSGSTFYIGHQSLNVEGTSLIPFAGKISDVRIYNKYILTSDAIANYKAGNNK